MSVKNGFFVFFTFLTWLCPLCAQIPTLLNKILISRTTDHPNFFVTNPMQLCRNPNKRSGPIPPPPLQNKFKTWPNPPRKSKQPKGKENKRVWAQLCPDDLLWGDVSLFGPRWLGMLVSTLASHHVWHCWSQSSVWVLPGLHSNFLVTTPAYVPWVSNWPSHHPQGHNCLNLSFL